VQASTWLTLTYGGGGLLGAVAGGIMADRISQRRGDARWYAWLAAAATALVLPFSFFVYTASDARVALLVNIGASFLVHAWLGPAHGTVQNLAGPQRRAMAAAVNLLVVNLVALGLGPLLVGTMSDSLNEWLGSQSLRYASLAVVALSYTGAAIHFLL